MARRSKNFEVVHRPASREDQGQALAKLKAALDILGVPPGGSFAVMAVSDQTSMADLDGKLGPFSKGSETSRKAALDNYPRSGSQRWRILRVLGTTLSGLTRDEIAAALDIPDSSTDARVGELRDAGFIEESDRTRPTRHGSQAAVLIVTQKGQNELRLHEDL